MTFVPVPTAEWKKGDYRIAASLARGSHTIQQLAERVGATLEHLIEDGLGPAQSFGARADTGRQIAFDFYELGPEGPNLIVLFQNGRCSKSEIHGALATFGVSLESVYWFAPEMVDS